MIQGWLKNCPPGLFIDIDPPAHTVYMCGRPGEVTSQETAAGAQQIPMCSGTNPTKMNEAAECGGLTPRHRLWKVECQMACNLHLCCQEQPKEANLNATSRAQLQLAAFFCDGES